MKIALYVDDIRRSIDDENFRHTAKSLGAAVIIEPRTYEDTVYYIENVWEDIVVLSLDHDLGEEKTGYDIAGLIEMHLYDGLIDSASIPVLRCHSANPVGRDNIDRVFEAIETRYMD